MKKRVVGYCRISKKDDVNTSIKYQKEMIESFVSSKPDWELINFYIDEGRSGADASSNREGYTDLVFDLTHNRFDIVVIKDTNRLNRNSVENNLIVQKAKSLGIEFYTTLDNEIPLSENEYLSLESAFDEFYVRQTSKKVRRTFKLQLEKGSLIGGGVPLYGYEIEKTKDFKKRIPNEKTAPIVRRIFSEFLAGKTVKEIKMNLFNDKIFTPGYFMFMTNQYKFEKYNNISKEERYNWQSSTIVRILRNREYTGDFIKSKYQSTLIFKTSNEIINKQYSEGVSRKIPKEEYEIFENHFEAIINRNDFDEVQKILDSQKSSTISKSEKKYLSILVCGNCKKELKYSKRGNDLETVYYKCRNNNCQNKPYIVESKIDEKVTNEIKTIFEAIKLNKDDLIEEFLKITPETIEDRSIETKISDLKKELTNIERKHQRACISSIEEEDEISRETYKSVVKKYSIEIQNLKQTIQNLQKKKFDESGIKKLIISFIENIDYLLTLDTYQKRDIELLIDKIVITNINQNHKDIEIIFKDLLGIINQTLQKM